MVATLDSKVSEDEYANLLVQRDYLKERRKESVYEFDRQVLALSAGALGLSIGFLGNYAPHPRPDSLWLLIVAWGGFVVAVVATTLSFFASAQAFRWQIAELDEAYKEKRQPRGKNRWGRWTRGLTRLGAVAFCVGVAFLALFAMVNLYPN
jgi:hypothetical protein